ncbi:MAG: archaetidylserine decarboxylase [Pseudomonadales bacterium]|jgi:phosphatidylserine decarboxylase
MIFAWLQHILPLHFISRCVGGLARSERTWIRSPFIRLFKWYFDVDLQLAEREHPSDYQSFNDFFTRRLKPSLREPSGLLSAPADGRISACGRIENNTMIQAKGKSFLVSDLLGQVDHPFGSGSFSTTYLSPRDYHRVHFPCAGKLEEATYIPGKLFSVNQQTTQHVDRLFARNERLVMHLSTEHGAMALVLVGAAIVAAIKPFWQSEPLRAGTAYTKGFNQLEVHQGQEAGQFLLGSTVILITERAFQWQAAPGDLIEMGWSMIRD